MPSIPTGGSELPRPVVETGATTRVEPAMRSPPMVPANPQTPANEQQGGVERRKEDRRQRRERVAQERRGNKERRKAARDAAEESLSTDPEQKKGRFINVRV